MSAHQYFKTTQLGNSHMNAPIGYFVARAFAWVYPITAIAFGLWRGMWWPLFIWLPVAFLWLVLALSIATDMF